MLPDRVSNPEPLTYEPGALPIALRGPANFVIQSNVITEIKYSFYIVRQCDNRHCKHSFGYIRHCDTRCTRCNTLTCKMRQCDRDP